MEEFVKDFQERQKHKDEKINKEKEEKIKPNINESKEKEEEKFSSIDKKIENGEVKVLSVENNENVKSDLTFKLIVIGNSFVGKSSLVERAIKNRFLGDYSATIGFDYCSFFINYDSKIIKLQIWDTCGQEIYQSLITNFYRNSSLAIMVYAINDRNSYENLDNWLKELKRESNPDAKIILIGNKADLESDRVVSYEEAKVYSKDYGFTSFFETSAKTGLNAQKVFISAGLTLYDDYLKYKENEAKNEKLKRTNIQSGNKTLIKRNKKVKKSGCC